MPDQEERNNVISFDDQLKLDTNYVFVEEQIFDWLKETAKQIANNKLAPLGAIIVLGDFERFDHCFGGMIQMKPTKNPIDMYISAVNDAGRECMQKYSRSPYDGAIIVNKTGQIIGVGIYLVVDNPTLAIPDDCGTRHKAAASFSLKNGITSVLTISEETNTVRIWKDGLVKNSYKGKAVPKKINGEKDEPIYDKQ